MKCNAALALVLCLAFPSCILAQDSYLGLPRNERVVLVNEFTLGNLPQVPDKPLDSSKLADSVLSPNDKLFDAAKPEKSADKVDSAKAESKADDSKKPASKDDSKKEDKKDDAKKDEKKDDAKKDEKKDDSKKDAKKEEKKWYEKVALRGYVQFRHNYPTHTEADSAPRQHAGDQSISSQQEFLIRRARLIFFGDVGEHLYLYVQPDLASTPNAAVDQVNFAQMRDAYGDVYVDKEKVHRFRVGQSKIPYGWENMQSSQNRLSLDRADSLNSAARNERDTGVFYYWTPKPAQDFFKEVNDTGLKGSGNYGVFALGAYNGQGGSLREQNDNLHLISRFTLPFETYGDQKWELGMQGFSGDYVVLGSRIQPNGAGAAAIPLGTRDTGNTAGHLDQRVAWSVVKYAQPFGMQAEYTIGKTPQLNAAQTAIESGSLHGGYLSAFYRYKSACHGEFWPYVRYQYYRGGYRSAANSPYSEIDEWNFGLEWQIKKEFELVTEYLITDRTNLNAVTSGTSYGQYQGHLLRFQFQLNF